MKRNLHICLTIVAGWAVLPLTRAGQNEAPPGTPGEKPAIPDAADPARPESKGDATRNRKPGAGTATNPATETEFVKTAAKKGMAEVKMAQLATEKASDTKVKDLAELLVKDHTAANTELKSVAEGLGVKIADLPDAKGKQKHDGLNGRTGKEFDTAFLEHMSMGHQKSIALYEAGRKVAKSENVIAFIDKTLPVIKSHAEKIDQLHTGTNTPTGTPKPGRDKR